MSGECDDCGEHALDCRCNELLACPFCGESVVAVRTDENMDGPAPLYFVECFGCLAETARKASKEAAIANWNRRRQFEERETPASTLPKYLWLADKAREIGDE